MNEDEAKLHLENYLEFKSEVAELEKQMKIEKDILKNYLEQKDLREFITDEGVILVQEIKQNSLNKKKLKALLTPQDWKFIHEVSKYNRMQIYSTESFQKRNEGLKKGHL